MTKWKKKEREGKGEGECAPATTAAAVGHARRRLHVRGAGVGGARVALAAKRRPGARGREGKREKERFAGTITTGGEEKESECKVRSAKKGGIDEWNREMGIGCSG